MKTFSNKFYYLETNVNNYGVTRVILKRTRPDNDKVITECYLGISDGAIIIAKDKDLNIPMDIIINGQVHINP